MNIEKTRNKYFPIKFKNKYQIVISNKEDVYKICTELFSQVFGIGKSSVRYRLPENRRKHVNALLADYLKAHHEWFLFLDKKGKPVGWFMGEAENAVTFYMRNTGILPKHQNKGLYTKFLKNFEKYLKEIGYERITSQHDVTNKKILISKMNAGFIICNLELTEMFGAMVKLVKILHKDRRDYFIEHFGDHLHKEFYDEWD